MLIKRTFVTSLGLCALASAAFAQVPDAGQFARRTAAEYRDRLGVDVTAVTVWRMLRRLGLTFKKSPSGPPSKTARTSPPGGRRGSRG